MPAPLGNNMQNGSQSEQTKATPATTKKVMAVPFARASKEHYEIGNTYSSPTPWGQTLNIPVPTYGYMQAVYLTLNATGGSGTATVTALEDAPWSAISNLTLSDVNGTPISNLSGYNQYLARLYGGYKKFGPTSAYAYTAVVTGANASGNFKIKVPIFQEFGRDGLGCLPNMDASAAYRVHLVQGAPSNVYGVAPTTPPTISTTIELVARSRPAGVDYSGRPQQTMPPSPGSVQYWTQQTFTLSATENTTLFSRVGNYIRNHILVFRASSDGTRATGETNVVPTQITFEWDNGQKFICKTETLRQMAYEITGFDAPAGVVPLLYTEDTQGIYGAEYGDDWMPTLGSTKLQLRFTCANAGTLQVLTNDIVPGDASIFSAPASELMLV